MMANMRKEDLLEYMRGVAESIEENTKRLQEVLEDDKLRRLATEIETFYVSLFDSSEGVFQSENMDKELVPPTPRTKQSVPSEAESPAKRKRPMARVQTGKGSPLKPRKAQVSKRQQRIRARRGFDMSDFGAGERRQQQAVVKAPDETVDQRQSTDSQDASCHGGDDDSQASSRRTPTPPIEPTPPPPPQPSSKVDEGPLGLQVRLDSRARSSVQRFQLLAAMSQDGDVASVRSEIGDEASDDELGLFAREIEHWEPAESVIEYALRDMWHQVSHGIIPDPGDSGFLKTLVRVHNTANAVANSMAHLKGYLVQQCHKRQKTVKEAEIIRDEIEENLRAAEYSEYMTLVTGCDCDDCSAVSKFDVLYNRCRNEGSGQQQPISDRPVHCTLVDLTVRSVRAKYKGLSASSLQKCHYFYLSTPKFSPPTLSTAIPTVVQTLTTAYMKRYANSFDVTEPCPKSWYINIPVPDLCSKLTLLEKQQVHLFDADGGEILVEDHHPQLLKDICTHQQTIRFRLPSCDAPEIRTAFKLTKRHGDKVVSVGTADVGMEALRIARKILFEATEIRILVRTRDDVPMVEIDSPRYRRALCHLIIKRDANDKMGYLLSELVALEGYMFPCFKYGIDPDVKDGMDVAIAKRKGMFRLPEETRQPGFLPWDIKDGHDASEPVPIRNVNVDIYEALWLCKDPTAASKESISDNKDPTAASTESINDNRYYVELTESKEWLEASCFVKKSTIPGAGLGLFLTPHPPIPKGQFVCLYATHSTTEDAMDATGSSRDYAIHTGRAGLWFDAEKQDGVCLGRFANQLHVRESLEEVNELSRGSRFTEMREEDWKGINDADAKRATVVYEQRKGQLVVVTSKYLPRTEEAEELFAHYGDMREYWLPLIRRQPDSFPEYMSDIVNWFLRSDECNWTDEQKQKWLGL